LVRARRGTKLSGGEDELFNGDIFTGRRALEKGLIDGIGDLRGVMRARFGDKVALKLVGGERRRWLPSLPFRGARHDPLELVAGREERLIWARFGLSPGASRSSARSSESFSAVSDRSPRARATRACASRQSGTALRNTVRPRSLSVTARRRRSVSPGTMRRSP